MPVDVDATLKYHDLRRIADLQALVAAREAELIEVAGWLVTERARVERLRHVADAAYELIYQPENITPDPLFNDQEWLRTQLDHLDPNDLADAQPEDSGQ